MNIALLPKIELHLHLDCGLSYEVVSAIDPSINKEAYDNDFIAPAKCYNLADFLTRAVKGFALMQTKEQLTLVVHDLFKQLKASNVIYAEIRFAPLQHLEQGLSPYEVVAITEAATAAAVKATGVEARLILCTLRHFSAAQSMQTVQLVQQFANTYVAGFDIAADEAGFPIDNHIAAFQYAKANNIPCTAHAGEAKGTESVWETLQYFGPTRIGHGVRSIEDPALVKHLHDNQIHLEICPSCNVQTNMYDTYAQHPIDQLYKAGVSLNINTDAPTIVNTTLNKEYQQLQQVFGWGIKEFYQCNLYAVKAAFIPSALQQKLLQRLALAYQQPL
ncbi:adenosine deaminase [Limnovirga soli]|uniref:adenosine deaminase n=1 Tax=Limnovirga soli TaxID=2656915 RepID=A0A8J8FJ32_9BACT|nr:adenosine deaminase [Limnovirga soli]NNV55989.1 adenosine deaminase [Limnovirga soli]